MVIVGNWVNREVYSHPVMGTKTFLRPSQRKICLEALNILNLNTRLKQTMKQPHATYFWWLFNFIYLRDRNRRMNASPPLLPKCQQSQGWAKPELHLSLSCRWLWPRHLSHDHCLPRCASARDWNKSGAGGAATLNCEVYVPRGGLSHGAMFLLLNCIFL